MRWVFGQLGLDVLLDNPAGDRRIKVDEKVQEVRARTDPDQTGACHQA